MVAYRLDNDIASYQEMFVDFKAMRRQYSELRVSFNEDNISLYDNLLNEWQPVDLFLSNLPWLKVLQNYQISPCGIYPVWS